MLPSLLNLVCENEMNPHFLTSIALFSLLLPTPAAAADFAFFHENVLGTSLELRVNTQSETVASKAEKLVLKEIDRLSRIFSTYDSSSQFSDLLRLSPGQKMAVSAELFEVLQRCEDWQQISRGTFSPAVELLSREWHASEHADTLPTTATLRTLAQQVRATHWSMNADGLVVTRESDLPLSLNAIAKGAILDYASDHVMSLMPSVSGVTINIGGDIIVAGDMHTNVAVADPHADAIGGQALQTFLLYRKAIATSGSSERFYEIGGQQYSHLIDARTGQPVAHSISATVLADDAATADAVATIVGVLPVVESLVLVNQLPGVECLLVSADGIVTTSAAWPVIDEKPDKKDAAKADGKHNTGHLMKIDFEISKPDNARRYRRPYVAVWVEDKDGFPVKTLSLFLMKDNPGPRWHRDLRRWYKGDQLRSLIDETSLIETVSKPTRNPGKYKVEWDGRDNDGKLLKTGEYTLMFEAAREHGTYQLIKHKFEFAGASFKKSLKGNVEIGAASVSYENSK